MTRPPLRATAASRLRYLLPCLGVLVAACGGESRSRRAERVPDEALPLPSDTIVAPWSHVPEADWLEARRWLVVSGDDDAARIADFEADSLLPLGPRSAEEIAKPFTGFTVGDTAYVADWAKGRLTIWANGALVGSLAGPAALRGILPRARDAAGQYYFEVPPIAGPDGSGNRDSIAIVRADARLTAFDTVAKLAPVDVAEVQLPTGRRYERLIMSGSDQWGVRADGRLWIARRNGNRVNTIDRGRERRGEPLPDPVFEVTRADREVFINSFPEDVRNTLRMMPFAPFKPPFEHAFADPAGRIWLRKPRAYGDSVRRYQVVDTSGMLARVLTTVGNGVLVAAGRDRVLMAETFADGVRLLEIRIPEVAPEAAAANR